MKKTVEIFFNERHGQWDLVEFAFRVDGDLYWAFLDIYHNMALGKKLQIDFSCGEMTPEDSILTNSKFLNITR